MMPTGYTSKLYEGEQSIGDFLRDAARGMGFCVTMRDDAPGTSLPESFEPAPYYAKAVADAVAHLDSLKALSELEIEQASEAAYEDALKDYEHTLEKRNAIRTRYENMLRSMIQWTPEHEAMRGTRKFAISQLQDSIEWDCRLDYSSPPEKRAPLDWLSDRIAVAEGRLESAKKSLADEEKRVSGRNEALAELRKEIQKLEAPSD